MKFNANAYKPNRNYTREIAEQKLISLGYKNFHFKSVSYINGASFYFESEDGKELRVSDHILTGKRAFNTVQIDLVERGAFTISDEAKAKREKEAADFQKRLQEMISKRNSKTNQ